MGFRCEPSLLISDQTQTTVWSLTILPEAKRSRVERTGGTVFLFFFLKRDRCQDRCGYRTRRVELVNDIDHVTGFADDDLARFSVAGVHKYTLVTIGLV